MMLMSRKCDNAERGQSMVNTMKLKGKIVECGMSISGVAEAIGLDKSTLYRKLKDPDKKLTLGEVKTLMEHLHLSSEEADAIFFTKYVAKKRQME